MSRIAFTFVLCVATLMVTQRARAAGPKASPAGPDKKRSRLQNFDLQPRPHDVNLPARTEGLDPGLYGEWFHQRFLWSPEEAVSLAPDPGRGALEHLTEVRWVEPKRDGLYRYVRKRARSYMKRLYVQQLDAIWAADPSFTANDYAEAMRRYRRAGSEARSGQTVPSIQDLLEGRRPPRVVRYPYVARFGSMRIDEDYRVQIDFHDLLGDGGDPAPGLDEEPVVPRPVRDRRPPRGPTRGRWFDLKVSPRVAVGASPEWTGWLRNYGGRVRVDVLPRRGLGPLFSSGARLKIKPDGEAILTIDLFEKRF